MVAETEAVGSKEMDMNLARPAVALKFEMMVLNILQAVTHFGLSGAEALGPEHVLTPFDGRGHRDRLEFRIHYEFWSKGTRTELRTGEVQIVLLFKLMIRKLVAHREANAVWPAIWSDQVNARDLRLLVQTALPKG